MKKKLFLLQFLFAVFFACSCYAQQNDYAVNFKNVPMKDFITFVSEFTGKNVIYNEADLRGNVTISSQKNMDAKEILDIFYSVMKLNGYQPVTKGDSIHIVAEKDMQAFDEEIKIQNHIHRLRPYVEICVRFYYYVFLYYKKIGRINGKGIGLQGLSTKALHGLIVPLPPKGTQWKIAKKVDEIFEQLEIMDEFQRNYVADIKALKSKIFDAAIQGKLSKQLPEDGTAEDLYAKILSEKAKILERCKGREDKKIKAVENDVPFEIPDHWKWIRLGDIGLFKKGPFGSALTKAMFVQKGDDTIKVYEQQHAIKKDWELGTYYITREYFNEKMSGFEVMSGDIIVSCAGTIGETYIMPDGIEQGIINQALMRVTLAEGIEKKFFQYYFDANLKKSAQEESNGSAIKNIPSFDVLKNWYFPLTSIEEQRRIVSKIDEILACM